MDEIRRLWAYQAQRNRRCGRRRLLIALYEGGAPLAEIARECGYASANTASDALYKMGVPARRKAQA